MCAELTWSGTEEFNPAGWRFAAFSDKLLEKGGPFLIPGMRCVPLGAQTRAWDGPRAGAGGSGRGKVHEKPSPVRRPMLIQARRGLISSGHSWVVESVRCESSAGRIVLAPLALGKRKAGRKHTRAFGDDMNAGGTDFFASSDNGPFSNAACSGKVPSPLWSRVGQKCIILESLVFQALSPSLACRTRLLSRNLCLRSPLL